MREAKIQCEGVGKTFIQKGNIARDELANLEEARKQMEADQAANAI